MDIKYHIWLSRVSMFNSKKIELLDYFGDIFNLWKYVIEKDNIDKLMDQSLHEKLKSKWVESEIEDIIHVMKNKNINLVNYKEEDYPQKLLNIEEFPIYLYYIGDIKKVNNLSVAIVGAREGTSYGKTVTIDIVDVLNQYNINVISGMARGIDGIAHHEALKGGFTAGVLGCGPDICYPALNKDIYNMICRKGCILSEFPVGTKPISYNFPQRNRIISGLSKVVIVVEGNEKSGSLITASTAADQGIPVMAVPGPIYSPKSAGPNRLIKDGASVYTEPQDLLELLDIHEEYILGCEHIKYTSKEHYILKFINYSPVHIDEIIKESNIDIKELYRLLFELQMKNVIECSNSNFYSRIKS